MTETARTAFDAMDSMYRYQRYFYDATRKYYLLGRDRLIEQMAIRPGDTVAEIGCGTGRNLILLARKHPKARFFGLDASGEMLRTAREKSVGTPNILFKTSLADEFEHGTTFGLSQPLDVIFFSYSISMIPPWKESINRALDNLKPGGTMYIVDFYDQKDLPVWFRTLLQMWLRKFHVQFWSELIPFLFELDRSGKGVLEISSVARRYAFIASIKKNLPVK
ncbi:MAG: class I SAM-dependent methyltransferase [Pyrinomonadaceae bacterium]